MRGKRSGPVLLGVLLLAGCAPEPGPEGRGPADKARRTRVLYLESMPRWEYRYLHNALVRDESFEVHCFLLAADPTFAQAHSLNPADPKFGESLSRPPSTIEQFLEYDVVILGDLGPESCPEGTALLLDSFVSGHGRGLVVLSGDRHMPRSWKGTKIEALLPVEPIADPPDAPEESGYHLTDAGKRSPLLALASDENAILELWEDRDQGGDGLKRLQWTVATRCKPAGQSLVETGPETARLPLFVTAQHGKGRVFFSATDETWRWRYRTGDDPYFLPFWRGVIEWAGRDK
ncbi:MAG: hypothetical protein FD180_934 [Planctomycetota bacterium]|nr:MAG: hypothetical protein FD180_934 [Planctomycetota bacterium]